MPTIVTPDTAPDPEPTEAEQWQRTRIDLVFNETRAMHSAFVSLQPLDYNARKRALRWLAQALEDCEVPF